jgi:hypothetical protein
MRMTYIAGKKHLLVSHTTLLRAKMLIDECIPLIPGQKTQQALQKSVVNCH